jgi:hypothetical protein
MKKIELMEAEIATMKIDMQKAIDGNKSCVARVRKSCQVIKGLCQELRGEAIEIREKNSK